MSEYSKEVVKKNLKYSLFTWSAQKHLSPMIFDRAEGLYMYDLDGNKYLEFASDQVDCNIGKSHPKVINAMKAQLDKISYAGPAHASVVKGELSEKLISRLPENFGKILYTNAGADANENAVKIARMYTGRQKIISCYNSYHGCTAGAAALTGDSRRWAVEPSVPGCIKAFDHNCYHCPFHKTTDQCKTECASHIEDIIQYEDPNNVAAVVVETVTGANGMCPPPKDYMKKLRKICDKYGVLLICDEVMAGFGRTGKFFAFENYDIIPDMVTMAKGLTSGYIPLGAVAVTNEIAEYFDDHVLRTGLTYSGHVLGCAAANACIDVMDEENMVENSRVMGEYLKKRELELQKNHPCVGDVRGIGLMTGLEIVFNRAAHESMHPLKDGTNPIEEFNQYMIKTHKILVGIKAPKLIVLAPSLTVTKEQIDIVIEALDDGLRVLDKYVQE
mgnify:CR=1 FL=1